MRARWQPAGMIVLSACEWGEPAPPNPRADIIVVAAGQSATVAGVIVGFSGVLEDARCPVDLVCVTPGNAVVELSMGPGVGEGPTYRVVLNTTKEPREARALGMSVRTVDLQPAPVSTRDIEPDDYVVRLVVESVEDSSGR